MQIEISPSNHIIFEEIKTPPENDTTNALDGLMKKIAEKEGFINYEIDKKCVSTNGGNFLGMLYVIDIKGLTRNGEEELNIFVKNIIKGDSLKVLNVTDVYNTEIFAYKELSKVFAELQNEAGVPIEERYKMVKVYDESNSEAIIMENIAKKGFDTYYRMDIPSLKFVEMSIKELAKFHSLSFVLQEKRPDYFAKKIRTMKNPITYGEDWMCMTQSVQKGAMKHIPEEFKEKIADYFDKSLNKYEEYTNDESTQVCLCHGDYRMNNIMMKMHNGEVTDIMPMDYQLMYYGCPVFDFFYFIFSCTDKEFRTAHMDNLKNLYFDTMSEFLAHFNLDADLVYPREQFEKVFREKLDYGLLTALLYLPFFLASENDVPDISNGFSDLSMQIDDVYKDRIRGVIDEYVEWGFL